MSCMRACRASSTTKYSLSPLQLSHYSESYNFLEEGGAGLTSSLKDVPRERVVRLLRTEVEKATHKSTTTPVAFDILALDDNIRQSLTPDERIQVQRQLARCQINLGLPRSFINAVLIGGERANEFNAFRHDQRTAEQFAEWVCCVYGIWVVGRGVKRLEHLGERQKNMVEESRQAQMALLGQEVGWHPHLSITISPLVVLGFPQKLPIWHSDILYVAQQHVLSVAPFIMQ